MYVKICGITTKDAALEAAVSGADFIGFVFAPSKRQITPADAADIITSLPDTIKKVGVFVNESAETIKMIAREAHLDIIQLHGDEPPSLADELPYPVIKAFPMTPYLTDYIGTYPCDYCLIDSPIGQNRGGNGTTFDWTQLENTPERQKIILAGGLTPENIQSAIQIADPVGVDVSSGVETDGRKDTIKIRQFINHAKRKDGNK